MKESAANQLTRCPILYQANELIIVDKPEGVLSHPNAGKPSSDMSAFEGPYRFNERKFETPAGPIWLIHRLDQDTSGVLLATKSEFVAKRCRELFEEEKVRKTYTALVSGRVMPEKGKWEDVLKTSRQNNTVRSRVGDRGKPNAELFYQVLKFYPKYAISLVRIELITGRTHQIRIQGSARYHPVIGDEIYGNFSLNKKLRKEIGLKRLFLHASAIEMKSPHSENIIKVESPLPEKLEEVLKKLD